LIGRAVRYVSATGDQAGGTQGTGDGMMTGMDEVMAIGIDEATATGIDEAAVIPSSAL
jgi:hypothetical protein